MITGYNTDVRHGNRIFHVQTEDKGLANPKIETLIYVGGEILDNYRSSYEDLLGGPIPESVIQTRMDDQHKLVIRDIKNGKYDPPGTEEDAEHAVFNERPLDQAILEYLQQEGDVDTLEMVMEEVLRPTFGAPFSLRLKARLCVSHAPVAGADVVVKVVSSLKKAAVLRTGRTDAQGLFTGEVELPPSQPGHCALLVACASVSGSDEIRVPIGAARE